MEISRKCVNINLSVRSICGDQRKQIQNKTSLKVLQWFFNKSNFDSGCQTIKPHNKLQKG